jgi:hypothetical protein
MFPPARLGQKLLFDVTAVAYKQNSLILTTNPLSITETQSLAANG